MEGFDLGRLNPISFERLVRALCFAKMGPAGTVYSSGPDGGRDFTYEGSIAGYEGKNWNGYLVLQAKFKDPILSQTDDIKWLKSELDGELKKYNLRQAPSSETEIEVHLDCMLYSRVHYPHTAIELAMGMNERMWTVPAIADKFGKVLSVADTYDVQHPAVHANLLKALEQNPSLESLYYPAALVLCAEEADKKRLLKIFSKVKPVDDGNRYLRLAVAVVRLIDCPNLDECVEEVLDILEVSSLLSAFLSGELLDVPRRLDILTAIIKKLRERNSPKWREFVPLARKGLDSRKSELTNSAIWNALQLPRESFEILLPIVPQVAKQDAP